MCWIRLMKHWEEKVSGVVINPFGKYFKADKKVIEGIFEVYKNTED